MKSFVIFFLLFGWLSLFCQTRELITLQKDWKFANGSFENAHLTSFDDSGWRTVSIPNGDPQSMEPFQSDQVKLFYGKAMLIPKSGKDAGSIEVAAKTKGIEQD